MKSYFKINEQDNVVVALKDLFKGEIIEIDSDKIELKEDVKRGHKIAIKKILNSENVVKYGYPIGHAIKNIGIGEWVHTHNIKTNLDGVKEYTFNQQLSEISMEKRNLTFEGYEREDGNVGIRNELWIVPTVGCVNGIADRIIERFKEEVKPEGIDGIEAFKHNYGCSQLGEDHAATRTMLGNLAKHPNAGGVLVLGLGCENNTMSEFIKSLGNYNEKRIKFLVSQEVSDEIEEGVKILKDLYENMKKDKRVSISISKLKVGLKCGGSDGLSGITANPLVGDFSDFLVSQGGTTILTEVPEMFGAETTLMNRAKDVETFDKTVHLINDFKEYFMSYNQPIYENPSPGNKAGGITTLEDKSLGCTQKSGKSTVADVLKYGETLKTNGLNLLSGPGNDLVAASALAAAGCHIVLFTTGRGTPFGTFVPTIKISTNSALYKLKPHWMDFNAGCLVEDRVLEDVTEDLMNFIIDVAGGKFVNNEINKFKELAILKKGVTL
ncbi:UxaA family hydrolase [Clostridium saccharobutylicum]|uniref:Altronate dehydratase UxaA n=1 Tax=Clostridium saccharobutylicum DSM 13864 TaxID=1345695 RepID=U5MR18_CLOSA|nr:altronate dehydratase family protein [Clostridium saccharobutylicum]AGX42938.1 altronate dehydratase UxaA [Clostridium saccharobutylicum DSM 13864]AQR90231.1 altronate dehydratase [Clostridium saccharobutylicum]AQS00137.1 altronate dehydratase [Clostridium saccharobutylicum]AQS09934.1 altronate dehydratase [Clostridium saccharobutylicum]AQS14120.1 altronate dehydratase [Clostridium saccharobutylicum]